MGSLITLGVLYRAGLSPMSPTTIAIYGDSPHPLANFTRYARAVGQKRMRSESSGHLAPVDFPGLALIDAWQQRSPWPILTSIFDGYNPPLELVLAQGEKQAKNLKFAEHKITGKVAAILRYEEPKPAFAIYDKSNHLMGVTRHIILALGHPGLHWPDTLLGWQDHPQVTHAYQQATKIQANEHVVVIGGGISAVQVWLSAIQAGAKVTALHRQPLRRQRLNAPRCAFSTAGVNEYRLMKLAERMRYLTAVNGNFPLHWDWEWWLWQAGRQGYFTSKLGELAQIQTDLQTENRFNIRLVGGEEFMADRVICATGFQNDVLAHPLIKNLVSTYSLPVNNGLLLATNDFRLPLSRPGSICAVSGNLARWALPVADTFAGIKYIARRLCRYLL